ncbi:hypothetical protein [Caulobacter sp. FWC2]|uniref:hypothetical protein n=1 Tax=Caulobacter sp. FWC2 TaxID=69664 RepID=UPI000C1624B4|nr:hypothetical protein [Caulobacter sp. FWC2]PIB92533.1 hypothetical protein CSW62_13705 [Caulobacter sp. FWC2]
MNPGVRAHYRTELERITELVSGPASHATFLFDDLAAEADFVCRVHAVPFCTALRAAVSAFQIAFVSSKDAAVAHAAACARLEVIALLADGR